MKHVNNPLVRSMIPKGIKYIVIDFSLSKSDSFFMSKTKKFYQSDDRYLLLIHYGEYKDSMVPSIRKKIAKAGEEGGITFSENIGILTDDVFKDFLGISNEFLSTYEDFQRTMTKIYENRRRSDLVELIELWEKSQSYFHFLGQRP